MRQFQRLPLVLVCFLISASLFSQSIDATTKFSQSVFKLPATAKPGDYIEKTIVIKVKQEFRSLCSTDRVNHAAFNQLFTSIGGKEFRRKFPYAKAPARLVNS